MELVHRVNLGSPVDVGAAGMWTYSAGINTLLIQIFQTKYALLQLITLSLNCSLIGHTRRTCAKFRINSSRGDNTLEDSMMEESPLYCDNNSHRAGTPTPFTPKRPLVDKTLGSTPRLVKRQLFNSPGRVHSSVNAQVIQNASFTIEEGNQVILTITQLTICT